MTFFFFCFVFSLLLDAMENCTQNKDFNHIKTNKQTKKTALSKDFVSHAKVMFESTKGIKDIIICFAIYLC